MCKTERDIWKKSNNKEELRRNGQIKANGAQLLQEYVAGDKVSYELASQVEPKGQNTTKWRKSKVKETSS